MDEASARLLEGGISGDPVSSLDQICKLAIEAGVYPKCERYYPFVLGAQPVRPIDLAGFYAAIANEGRRPTPHVVEQIVHFFTHYKDLEPEKWVRVGKWGNRDEAYRVVLDSLERARKR